MSDQERAAHEEPAPRRRTPTYVAVIVVEVLVVAALWLFGGYFSN
ncbi:MAG TPA: hypothetical protein VIK00_00045 [Candidatus Limnocylindrales bacterium]|jgi:hypothetical protein